MSAGNEPGPTAGTVDPEGNIEATSRDIEQDTAVGDLLQSAVDAALRYAERGWFVFPVAANKMPCISKADGGNGFLDATTDPATINAWWQRFPFADIGIACGASGLLVVDIDGPTGEASFAAVQGLESDRCEMIARTPRGGRHLIYQQPAEPIGCKIGVRPKVDIRGHGGYIVAPSPASPGRVWLVGDPLDGDNPGPTPEWVEQFARAGRSTSPSDSNSGGTDSGTAMPLPEHEVQRIRAALAFVDADARDVWIRVGMALKSTCAKEQAFAIWCDWSRTSPKFDPVEQRRQWDSLKEFRMSGTEVTIATLFHIAQQFGYVGETVELQQAPPAPPAAADPFAGRWHPLTSQWTEEEPPPQRWLVCERRLVGMQPEGLLARGIVALLVGPGGIGKTEVMAGLGIAIATRGQWLDRFPVDDAAGRVAILAAEEDEAEMRRRIHRLTRRLSAEERAELHGRVVVVPMHARNVALLTRAPKTGAPTRAGFLAALRNRLTAEAGPEGWAAIIAGPLSRLGGVQLDADNEAATALVQALETLTEVPGSPTVIVDCHTPATARKRDASIEETRPRGPTGLGDGVRCVMAMHRPQRGKPIEFAITKSNRGRDDLPVLHLERGADGVLRCTGEAPNEEQRREANEQQKVVRHAEDMERRVALVVATLARSYSTNCQSLSRETIATQAGGTLHKNRAAVDEALARGLIHRAGGTSSRPQYAPGSEFTSDVAWGGSPPIPPDATRRDASAPSRHGATRRATGFDATRRDELADLDTDMPATPKGKRQRRSKSSKTATGGK